MVPKFRTQALSVLVLVGVIFSITAPASAASDLLPDLGMAKLRRLQVENTADGRRLLRFTAIIVNKGPGPIEVVGVRPSTAQPRMTTKQRIYQTDGTFREVPTGAEMYFAGDGHTHWHLFQLETYELDRLDNGAKVGTGEKMGFCFFDNFQYNLKLPGAPQNKVYRNCGGNKPEALSIPMGISVGWGDRYVWSLLDQYIDITGLNAGQYRLKATADESNWFLEADETNNATWVDIQLTGSGVNIISYGPFS